MKIKDKPCRPVAGVSNSILEIMAEPIGDGGQSLSEVLHNRLVHKAVIDGHRASLLRLIKDLAAHEIKKMGRQRLPYMKTLPMLNLEFERVGEPAALLGIAKLQPAPPLNRRHPLERDQRYGLAKWVVPFASKLGVCSKEHRANIHEWESKGCPQWRRWHAGLMFEEYEYLDHETGEYALYEWARPSPAQSNPRRERSIHPFDKKVRTKRAGKTTRSALIEVVMQRARTYALTHPGDIKVADDLMKIQKRMLAAREKHGGSSTSSTWDLDDDIRGRFAVASLEDALIGTGGAEIRFPYRTFARAMLKPWLVQAALDRFKKRRFTLVEQMLIVTRTLNPEQVIWPECWELDWYPKRASSQD